MNKRFGVVDGLAAVVERHPVRYRRPGIAAFPGTYTGPESCAYLYYTDEDKHWEEGSRVIVIAR